jgi:DNA-binding transcriptional ArsR family regulator
MTDHKGPQPIIDLPQRDGMLYMTPEQASLFSDETRNQIITLLAERPATTKQLAEALDKPKGSVGHHLKALEEAGLVEVVRTRKVRAITEKYYGRVARTYVFPRMENVSAEGHGFFVEAMREMREPLEGEDAFATLRHARIPAERVREFALDVLKLAEEFAVAPRSGATVYGFVAGIYPTDLPSLADQPSGEDESGEEDEE